MDQKKFELQFYPVGKQNRQLDGIVYTTMIEAMFLPADSVLLRFRDLTVDENGGITLIGVNYAKIEDVSLVQNEDGSVALVSLTENPISFEKFVRSHISGEELQSLMEDDDDAPGPNVKMSAGPIPDDEEEDRDPEPGIKEEIQRAQREDQARQDLRKQIEDSLGDLPEEEIEEETQVEEPAETHSEEMVVEQTPVQQVPVNEPEEVPAGKRHIKEDSWKSEKKKKKKFRKLQEEADDEDYRRNKQFKNKKRNNDAPDGMFSASGFAAYMAKKDQ